MLKVSLTLGSLFDGSGGFPLDGLMCGIKPIWVSEIEIFAIFGLRGALEQHYTVF